MHRVGYRTYSVRVSQYRDPTPRVGNEFIVTLFRGGMDTIQKAVFTTQKTEITTQKKVLDFLKINPKTTRTEKQKHLEISLPMV